MSPARLAAATLALMLAACSQGGPGGHRGPGGPSGPGTRSPMQNENTAAFNCRIKPYAASNGSVTRTALDKGLRQVFAAADANRDGTLQKTEISALNAARAESCDGEPVIDWDGGGRMTFAAFAARTFTLFDRVDLDSDGVLTPEEIEAAGRASRPRGGPPPGAVGPGGQP